MSSRSTEFRVGVFVIVSLLIATFLIFLIGNQSNLFRSQTSYEAIFESVSGLRPGSPVRIAGVSCGTVDAVVLGEDGRIHVEVSIIDEAVHLVRTDSIATIGNKGLLGDKLVDISVGRAERVAPGGILRTESPEDLSDYLSSAGEILGDTRDAVRATLGDEQFRIDLRETVHNLAAVSKMAAEGDGSLRTVLTDPELAENLSETVRQVRTTSQELALMSRSLRAVTDEIAHGNGTAHELVYGPDGARLARNLADASAEVAQLLRDVRTGDGTVHDLVYEDEANALVENLTATSADIRAIVADVRAGRGSLGGLLVDPSVYEDLKRLVGDLERNDILRALVRYSIRRDETVEPAGVTAAPQSTPAASVPP